ncbi:MAG: hypothetical protein AAF270_04305 [Pseudomonadota bacterium]
MAFQEKSAWIMVVALLLGGAFYLNLVSSFSAAIGTLAPPLLPTVIVYTIILIVVAVIGHILIGIMTPREANEPLDERERRIFSKASSFSGYVLGLGVIVSLGHYLILQDGDLLFYSVFASLMIAQIAEYLCRIALYRFGAL